MCEKEVMKQKNNAVYYSNNLLGVPNVHQEGMTLPVHMCASWFALEEGKYFFVGLDGLLVFSHGGEGVCAL